MMGVSSEHPLEEQKDTAADMDPLLATAVNSPEVGTTVAGQLPPSPSTVKE
jgi:hypothetical protein